MLKCGVLGANRSEDDPAGENERFLGTAAELPSGSFLDAEHGKDHREFLIGTYTPGIPTVADQLSVRQGRIACRQ